MNCQLINKRGEMSEKIKRIDPRVKRSHQLLTGALMELLREQDFNTITVQDIVERATLNRTTFYAHFEDKYALLKYAIEENFQRFLGEKMPDCPRFCEDHLRLLFLATAQFLSTFAGQCRTMAYQPSYPPIERYIQHYLYELVSGWVDLEDKSELATVISWSIFGSVFQWSRDKGTMSAEELADHIIPLIVSGVHPYFA
jgi:AcrR family transcriptional regulator